MKRTLPTAVILVLALSATACGGSSGSDGEARKARGPIKIWYANNPDEIAWAKKTVGEWNKANPDQKVTAEEIPAGKTSEEVIGAAISAGNAPCLVFNTSPAAISGFEKQGGLVPLDDFPGAKEHIEERSGSLAEQYASEDGKYYQLPWKSNPVMISYDKKAFEKAGIDPESPPLGTYEEFLATSEKLVADGGVDAAIWPAPSSEFFQPWFDFYPLFAAESDGRQLVEDGKARFNSTEGKKVADFWRKLYAGKLSPNEKYNGDAFADGKAAMTIAGPWAAKVYGEKIDYGVVPVPTSTGKDPADTHTFSDAKSVGMYTSCDAQGTAWDVLKFATSKKKDGELLDRTGQMPMREKLTDTYADFFAENPQYEGYAQAAERTVEVPNVPNSIAIWQGFRDAYSQSVIFGKTDPAAALDKAAAEAEKQAGQQ